MTREGELKEKLFLWAEMFCYHKFDNSEIDLVKATLKPMVDEIRKEKDLKQKAKRGW